MLTIRYEPSLDQTDTDRLYAGLLATDPAEQPRDFASLVLTLRDNEAKLVGGLLGSTVWNWLSIDVLWTHQEVHGRGYGRALMQAAETLAIERRCTHARLDTFDFQARTFYERLGFEVYAQLDDFPAGHIQFHMRKALRG